MILIKCFVVVLLGLLPRVTAASDSLLSLYREALFANAGYLAVQAGVDADRENQNIALGQFLPSLSASGNYSRSTADRKVGSAPGERFDYDSYAYSLSLRQPIYRKYNFALYEQAKAQGEAADARLSQSGNELLMRLATAYMEALFADDQIRLLEVQKEATRAQMVAAEKALIAGNGTRIDVDEARARFYMIEAQAIELGNARQHSRRVLGALVNRGVTDLAKLDLSRFKLLEPKPLEVEVWVAAAEAQNAEYQGLLAECKVAEQEVEKVLAGHYPTLDLVANVGKSGNDNLSYLSRSGDTYYNTSNYGVQLTIPLFSGGQISARGRQARAKLNQLTQQTEETRRNLSVRIQREYSNVIQGVARVRALERAEASAQQTVISAKKGVEAGVRSTLDVLQVEEQYFTILRDLYQARYAYLVAWLKLKGLAGILAEPDLMEVSRQFELKK